ncbi:MAG: social motility TPR repeat lipoprotein Tgl [Myxococcales bacterium]|nr:social motility TPR repeat lipoprotein Tgl [Myxococcales bacterium]
MYTIDERLKGLPAVKEQVVQLYQSLNQPHLAVPGRSAGPATAYVLGLRGPSGFAVFVYLYLSDAGQCAVYVPTNGTVAADKYQAEEAEALGFVESMGFIMDNLNFRGRPPDEQETIIRSAPVFQREPPPPSAVPGVPMEPGGKPATGQKGGVVNIGKLFAAFCLSFLVSSCAHWVSQENRDKAQSHYDLAVGLISRNGQQSYTEIEKALEFNRNFAEAWHVKGILLHHSFGKLDEAKVAYEKAIELKQPFSEAMTNLGNLYMDMKRYDEAIALYEKALNDVLYGAPFIAHGNMGWALYKKGDVKNATEHLKASVTINPKYCLGYSQLGQLFSEQGQEDESCKQYSRYHDACPEAPDGFQKTGLCQLRAGKKDEAIKSFQQCFEKATNLDLKDLCLKLKEQS